jgi:hypothetical protein
MRAVRSATAATAATAAAATTTTRWQRESWRCHRNRHDGHHHQDDDTPPPLPPHRPTTRTPAHQTSVLSDGMVLICCSHPVVLPFDRTLRSCLETPLERR